MDSYDPQGDLAGRLEYHVQEYRSDFRKYWHLDAATCPPDFDAEYWSLVCLLDQVGSRILTTAHALRVDGELTALLKNHRPLEEPHETAKDLLWYEVAQSRAEIELAAQAVSRLWESKERLQTLLLHLSRFDVSARAAAYIDRMVQCYLWSMDTECAVMARSVLETALEELLPDDRMTDLGYRRGRFGFDFGKHCDAAEKIGLLSDTGLQYANEIRRAGNDAVHSTPGLHPSAFETLARTIVCLRELFPTTAY